MTANTQAPDNALARGSIPSATPGGPNRSDNWFWVRNDESETIDEYSFVSIERITDTTVVGAVYKALKPTADSMKNFAITLHKIPAGGIGRASMFGYDNGLTLRFAGTAPAAGDTIGTKAGQYEGEKDQTGCVVLGVDATASLCFVNAIGGGGGGGSVALDVVQTVADGSNGSVSVKTMTLKGDVTLSPNYELTGDARTTYYFKQ